MSEPLRVWIDQDLCTGDGLCVQYAPEVFEFDVDGLAYVKDDQDELLATRARGPTCRTTCASTSSPKSPRARPAITSSRIAM